MLFALLDLVLNYMSEHGLLQKLLLLFYVWLQQIDEVILISGNQLTAMHTCLMFDLGLSIVKFC